jgi:hypothetical protein
MRLIDGDHSTPFPQPADWPKSSFSKPRNCDRQAFFCYQVRWQPRNLLNIDVPDGHDSKGLGKDTYGEAGLN